MEKTEAKKERKIKKKRTSKPKTKSGRQIRFFLSNHHKIIGVNCNKKKKKKAKM